MRIRSILKSGQRNPRWRASRLSRSRPVTESAASGILHDVCGELRYDRALALGLKDRLAPEDVSISSNKKASTNRN